MGLFKRNRPDGEDPSRLGAKLPSFADQMALANQMQAQAMQLQAQMMGLSTQPGQGQAGQAPAGSAQAGSGNWMRQVLSILAPPQPGYVKRCSCVACGAPKKLPTITAYVYCDYCAALIDFDLRRASESDSVPGAAYAATVNGTYAASQAAIAAGDRHGYHDLQRRVYEAYVTYVPMAVSHRARNDAAYRQSYIEYLAQAAVVRAFEPESQALEAEMKQRVLGLRYSGNMFSPTVAAESFWPMVDTMDKQIELGRRQYLSAGLADLDPDRAQHLTGKFAWSGFCQGWLGLLPADTAAQLLDRAGLTNEYAPIQPEDGQPRHCGGCGGEFSALPGAKAVICEGCGRRIDLGSAEIPCTGCGATMTLPAGGDEIACPYCQAQVRRAGIW